MTDPVWFIECICEWWEDISYSVWMYFALFLPIVMIAYQMARGRGRKIVLLAANWFFFFSLSGFLLAVNILTTLFVFEMGRKLEAIGADPSLKRKEKKKKKKLCLALGVMLLLAALVGFKYLDFIGLNIVRITQLFGIAFDWDMLEIVAPVGISYYTLEAIAYLSDVYWEKTKAEDSLINMFLFMSLFAKLVVGPISRYTECGKLFECRDIKLCNVEHGYQRILWGLFKKLVIADQLAPGVKALYESEYMDGGVALFSAVLFTIQEYMDFSGAIDIALGSADIFGVRLHENFRQPFFAKNASDFWRRWHITLGTFFRDYIFYPVSFAAPVTKLSGKVNRKFGRKVSRFVPPAIALFFVWLANGLWHGARWTYVFYGMYYFVLILIENILEEPFLKLLEKLRLKETSAVVRVFRYVKLFFIVIIGEMFFRADTLARGFEMFRLIFTDLKFDMVVKHIQDIGIDRYGYFAASLGIITVSVVEILKEAGIPIRRRLEKLPAPVRFAFWYCCIFTVIIFGAYGSGYDVEDLVYAQF